MSYPSNPSWGWNKASPKTSLYTIGMAHTANAFMLNLVELVHWTPIIPAFLMSQSILTNNAVWTIYFDNDEQRTLLFLLSPVIAFFGGLPGIMMHTYEGWQVAPFDNPLEVNVLVTDKNNQWLRIVAYFFIFNMQYIGLQAFSYAVLGPTYFFGYLKWLSILGFFIGYLGNQDSKATFYFKGGSTFPIAWTTLVPFIMAASLNMYAFIKVGGIVYSFAPLLIASGGVIEGLFAETVFDQKIHAFAVILFNAGFWLELNMIQQVGYALQERGCNHTINQ
jgi:hypothetical protein